MNTQAIINQQQRAHSRTEKALQESRCVISEALELLENGGDILAKQKLRNYVRGVSGHGKAQK